MDLCPIPIELFNMIALADSDNITTLRLVTRALRDTIELPTIQLLHDSPGRSRYMIFTHHGNYKLQQLWNNSVLTWLRFTNGLHTITIDTKRCFDNYMADGDAGIAGSASITGGKANGDNSASNNSVPATRITPRMFIPRGNRVRRSIHNGNVITYFYTSVMIDNTTVTSRSLTHIKNIPSGHQTYKIWMNNHYLVLEYDSDWRLKRDVYEESRIPCLV